MSIYTCQICGKETINNRKLSKHLDHKLSIVDGFYFKIDPKIMASIYNLEMLSSKDNHNKRSKSSITKEELLNNYGI